MARTTSGRTAGRLPRTGNMKRIHTHMEPAWQRAIDRAARRKGVSRSYYIATAAHEKAKRENEAAAKTAGAD